MSTYDETYLTENFFGTPYAELITFFQSAEQFFPNNTKSELSLIDLGCGQGRDSVPIAQMGYKVTSVDLSSVGITQIQQKAEQLGLNIHTQIADFTQVNLQEFDFVLMDSIFHFHDTTEILTEKNNFLSLIQKMKKGSILCHFLQSNTKAEQTLKELCTEFSEIIYDDYVNFQIPWDPNSSCKFHWYVLRK